MGTGQLTNCPSFAFRFLKPSNWLHESFSGFLVSGEDDSSEESDSEDAGQGRWFATRMGRVPEIQLPNGWTFPWSCSFSGM